MSIYPDETPEYREARNYLKQLETAARRANEELAAARRRLPPGGRVPQDYVFEEMVDGAVRKVRLSELFRDAKNTLGLYSWMFNDKMKQPCPMCSGMIDSWDGVVRHISQRMNLAIVADSPIQRLVRFARDRGWRNLRILSTAGSTYSRDYHGVTPDGSAIPNLNVFRRAADGSEIRHVWGVEELPMDAGQDPRNLDPLNPIFAFLDTTPEGRGDFYTKNVYRSAKSI